MKTKFRFLVLAGILALAALAAGYAASIINVETIAPAIAPLGIGSHGSLLYMLHRVTIAEDAAAVENYIKHLPYKGFQITPNPVGAEPATMTGPDYNELIYDQVIYFGPYFEEP